MYLLSLAASGGLVSPPGGEGGVENSGKEAGGPMANERQDSRQASLGLQGCRGGALGKGSWPPLGAPPPRREWAEPGSCRRKP